MKSQYQLGSAFYCQEAPCIADLVRILFVSYSAPLLLPDIGPDLVHLNIGNVQILDHRFHVLLALLPGQSDKAHDRIAIHASDSFSAPDRVALR